MKNRSFYKNLFSIIRRLVYLGLPVTLLYVIFKRVDLGLLLENLQYASPWLILLGIFLKPAQIMLGSIRWKAINQLYCSEKISAKFMIHHYWAGMAAGYFTPANLGWDAYKVVAVGRKFKKYTAAFYSLIAEKCIGLTSVLLMLVITYPLITGYIVMNESIFSTLYAALLIGVFGLIVPFFIVMAAQKQTASYRLKNVSKKIITKLLRFVGNDDIVNKIREDYQKSLSIFSIFKRPAAFFYTLGLSLGILFAGAVCSQIFFLGLDYEISFFINLFAAPVFFILFIIPISFGSIGIREGVYILFYGQFGVPLETALLVSFFNLLGIFLSNIIGGLFMLNEGIQENINTFKDLSTGHE